VLGVSVLPPVSSKSPPSDVTLLVPACDGCLVAASRIATVDMSKTVGLDASGALLGAVEGLSATLMGVAAGLFVASIGVSSIVGLSVSKEKGASDVP
jgi:hypothetical protein